MTRAIAAVAILFFASAPVRAEPEGNTSAHSRFIGAGWWDARPDRPRARGNAIFLPHPSGCPTRQFCGCGASVRIFGRSIRELWPSSAWFKFPRSTAAPGNVAVRHGHVFVLESHVGGSNWIVSDYNSGGHRSRRHVRSIAGYAIVNPRA